MISVRREFTFDAEEFRARRKRVAALMEARGVDTLVLHSPSNIYYLSGHYTLNIWDYQCLIVPRTGQPVMLIWHFEEGRFAATAVDTDLVMFGGGADPVAETHKVLADRDLLGGTVGFEKELDLPACQSLRASCGHDWKRQGSGRFGHRRRRPHHQVAGRTPVRS